MQKSFYLQLVLPQQCSKKVMKELTHNPLRLRINTNSSSLKEKKTINVRVYFFRHLHNIQTKYELVISARSANQHHLTTALI